MHKLKIFDAPREIEAMAFTKAALMLEEAKTTLDDYDAYSSALKFNQLLWTIIQADVVDKENKLPPQIKANILSLSIFVDRQTIKALANTKEDYLEVLININKNLAEGLMARPMILKFSLLRRSPISQSLHLISQFKKLRLREI